MDVAEPTPGRCRVQCGLAYAEAVARAGGLPVFLPPLIDQIGRQLDEVDGLVLTGGADPRMEAFGEPTHPAAQVMHDRRQAYETALLAEVARRPRLPVLGICLGMQMLALANGGRLDQHLPDTLGPGAERHREGAHRLEISVEACAALGLGGVGVGVGVGEGPHAGEVASHHHQAVRDPGSLRVIARDADGTIEAVVDPGRAYTVGVQWHPERTSDAVLGQRLFDELVRRAVELAGE